MCYAYCWVPKMLGRATFPIVDFAGAEQKRLIFKHEALEKMCVDPDLYDDTTWTVNKIDELLDTIERIYKFVNMEVREFITFLLLEIVYNTQS